MKNPPIHKPEDFDADKSFLLSFLPDLKKNERKPKIRAENTIYAVSKKYSKSFTNSFF